MRSWLRWLVAVAAPALASVMIAFGAHPASASSSYTYDGFSNSVPTIVAEASAGTLRVPDVSDTATEGWATRPAHSDPAFLTFLPPGVGAETAGGIDGTTTALQEHLAGAVERFNVEGLTEGQQSALVDNPGLESAFRGQRIDTFFKESLNNAIESGTDPRVANLYVTRSGEFGPDVFDLGGMNQWWDVTTPGSWAQHVADYTNPFGTGIPLFTP